MATIQNDYGKGSRVAVAPRSAGAVHKQRFTFDFTGQAIGANDIVEIGVLPSGCVLADAILVTEGAAFAADTTADIGLMTGVFGDGVDTTRTSNDVIFTAADLTLKFQRLVKADALLLEPVEADRSVGVKFSAAIPAAAGKKLHLILFYHQ